VNPGKSTSKNTSPHGFEWVKMMCTLTKPTSTFIYHWVGSTSITSYVIPLYVSSSLRPVGLR
jgi:hypothetical protein